MLRWKIAGFTIIEIKMKINKHAEVTDLYSHWTQVVASEVEVRLHPLVLDMGVQVVA